MLFVLLNVVVQHVDEGLEKEGKTILKKWTIVTSSFAFVMCFQHTIVSNTIMD